MKIYPYNPLIKPRDKYEIGDIIQFKENAFNSTFCEETRTFNGKIVKIKHIFSPTISNCIEISTNYHLQTIHWDFFKTED